MYSYMKNHEKFILNALETHEVMDFEQLCKYHLEAIRFVQHERLIHLMVTFFFAGLLILSVVASLIIPALPYFLLDLILIILLGFYIRHYYRLENGVQYWYELYKEMILRCSSTNKSK